MKRFVTCLALALAVGAHGAAPAPSLATITAPELRELISGGTTPVTLVHVWATWCPPCILEFPDIVALTKKYQDHGLRVLLVSADAAGAHDAIADFLAARQVDWPTYRADNINDDFVKTLSTNWTGAIPASFYFGPDEMPATELEGAHPYAEHEEVVRRLLNAARKGKREK